MSGFWLAVALAVIVLIGVRQRTAGTAVLSKALPYVILVAVLVAPYAWFPFPLALSETRRLLAANLGPNTWFVTDPLGVYVVLAPVALLAVWLVYRGVVGVKRARAARSPTASTGTDAWQYHQEKAAREKVTAKRNSLLLLVVPFVVLPVLAWLVWPHNTLHYIELVWRPVACLLVAGGTYAVAALSSRYGSHGYLPYWLGVIVSLLALGASAVLAVKLL